MQINTCTSRNSSTICNRSFSKTRFSCSLIVDPVDDDDDELLAQFSCLTCWSWAARLWSWLSLLSPTIHPFWKCVCTNNIDRNKSMAITVNHRHTWFSGSGRGDSSKLPTSFLRCLPTWLLTSSSSMAASSSSPLRRFVAPDMVGSDRHAGPNPLLISDLKTINKDIVHKHMYKVLEIED